MCLPCKVAKTNLLVVVFVVGYQMSIAVVLRLVVVVAVVVSVVVMTMGLRTSWETN